MKTSVSLCLLVFTILSTHSLAQINAITDTGEEVVLFDNKTWRYKDEEIKDSFHLITQNPVSFMASENASFDIKSKAVDLTVALDPKTWTFARAETNEDAEYEFKLKDGDVYGMLITEKIEIPLNSLRDIALENGQQVAPNLQIIEEDRRTVNGLELLYMKMEGSFNGIDIAYIGYYYSNEQGTTQFVSYTGQSLISAYEDQIFELLNGLKPNQKEE